MRGEKRRSGDGGRTGTYAADQIEANMKLQQTICIGGAGLCTGTACDGYRAWI